MGRLFSFPYGRYTFHSGDRSGNRLDAVSYLGATARYWLANDRYRVLCLGDRERMGRLSIFSYGRYTFHSGDRFGNRLDAVSYLGATARYWLANDRYRVLCLRGGERMGRLSSFSYGRYTHLSGDRSGNRLFAMGYLGREQRAGGVS
jgi:translation initiation factor IF-1